jgi:putative transposase
MVLQGVSAQVQSALTDSALSGWALGDPEFVARLQQSNPRRLSKGMPGRPPRRV